MDITFQALKVSSFSLRSFFEVFLWLNGVWFFIPVGNWHREARESVTEASFKRRSSIGEAACQVLGGDIKIVSLFSRKLMLSYCKSFNWLTWFIFFVICRKWKEIVDEWVKLKPQGGRDTLMGNLDYWLIINYYVNVGDFLKVMWNY